MRGVLVIKSVILRSAKELEKKRLKLLQEAHETEENKLALAQKEEEKKKEYDLKLENRAKYRAAYEEWLKKQPRDERMEIDEWINAFCTSSYTD